MNPAVKKALDKAVADIATKTSTSEKFVNLCVNMSIICSKLGVISMFAKSDTINVQQAVDSITGDDVTSAILVAAALAGIEDAQKVKTIYEMVANAVGPILQTAYTETPSKLAS